MKKHIPLDIILYIFLNGSLDPLVHHKLSLALVLIGNKLSGRFYSGHFDTTQCFICYWQREIFPDIVWSLSRYNCHGTVPWES